MPPVRVIPHLSNDDLIDLIAAAPSDEAPGVAEAAAELARRLDAMESQSKE